MNEAKELRSIMVRYRAAIKNYKEIIEEKNNEINKLMESENESLNRYTRRAISDLKIERTEIEGQLKKLNWIINDEFEFPNEIELLEEK
ncbi:hypothetical protein R0K17_18985, partial [Planococcus sp. SIMBA_143]